MFLESDAGYLPKVRTLGSKTKAPNPSVGRLFFIINSVL